MRVPLQIGDEREALAILGWYKGPGERLEAGEPLLRLRWWQREFDALSPVSGVLDEVLAQPGERLRQSQLVAYIETEGESAPSVEVPYAELRLRMANHLWQSSVTAVPVTTWMEIDATRLLELRERWLPYFEAREGAPLGLMPFFVRAAVRALKAVPELSALILPDRMVYPRRTAVGVVVAVEGGVRIAKLDDVAAKTFGQIARELHQTSEAARSGTLPWDADRDPVFTISSAGADGPLFSSPMVPVPAAGILGLDAITLRPMVVGGRVEARPGLYASLTFDHRAVDGQQAGRFLRVLKQALEDADFEWEGSALPHVSTWGT